jgi:ankyrin repeat protein
MGNTPDLCNKLIQAVAQSLPEEAIEELLIPTTLSIIDDTSDASQMDINETPSAESLIAQTKRAIDTTPLGESSALIWAADTGRVDIVQQLLPLDEIKMTAEQTRQLANLCLQLIQKRGGEFSALQSAVKNGHEDTVAFLLKTLVQIESILPEAQGALYKELAATVPSSGYTLLMTAAVENYIGIARLLLQHGIRVTTEDNEGWTALLLAEEKRYEDSQYEDMAELIDEYWPGYPSCQLRKKNLYKLEEEQYHNPEFVQKQVKTIQHYLIAVILHNTKQHDTDVFKILLSDSLSLKEIINLLKQKKYIDDNAYQALLSHIDNIDAEGLKQIQQYIKLFQFDKTHSDQLRFKNEKGYTLLVELISCYKWLPAVKGLIELLLATKKVEVDAASLANAIQHAELDTVELLRAYGADINNPMDRIDTSSLMFACYLRKREIFTWLLAKGVDLTARNLIDNETALLYVLSDADRNKHDPVTIVVPYIIELLDHGADVTVKDAKNNTFLISFAHSLSILVRASWGGSSPPLHDEVYCDLLDLLKRVSANNATINDENNNSETALSKIIESKLCLQNKLGFIGCLVEAGADLNKKNKHGKTAMELIKSKLEINDLAELNLKLEEEKAKIEIARTALGIKKIKLEREQAKGAALNSEGKRLRNWESLENGSPPKKGRFFNEEPMDTSDDASQPPVTPSPKLGKPT